MPRIGIVPYINALPLTFYLVEPTIKAVPSKLEKLMEEGKLDVALMPSFSFLSHPDWAALPTHGVIASNGQVDSVAVFLRPQLSSLGQIKSINYTNDSKTSVSLFKVIYHAKTGRNPALLLEGENHPDAQLIIGDQALKFADAGWTKIDLGKCWKDLTGLPFVYALWVARSHLIPALSILAAKEKGLKNLDSIVESITLFPPSVSRPYLTSSIQYEMLPAYWEGLKKFRDCCVELGLLKSKRPL